ncbi:MAG: class 1 isoprenoid biosynthesis enzyme [Patescibacteria group bacterium]
MIISHIISVIISFLYSLKYFRLLEIQASEIKRYFFKSMNLALCYAGFSSGMNFSIFKQAQNAGKAAFLCCAYDVVTDWRSFDPSLRKKYERILNSMTSPDLAKMAIDLYQAEVEGILRKDGLERGEIAFCFVTKLMGVYHTLTRKINIADWGIILQIIDDVLDYEEDAKRLEINCLTTDNKDEYLKILIEKGNQNELDRIFPNGLVLKKAIRIAIKKAFFILNGGDIQSFNARTHELSDITQKI